MLKTSKVLFAHANGFHPKCYTSMIDALDCKDKLSSLVFSPFDKGDEKPVFNNWNGFRDELIDFAEKQTHAPSIAIGHSLGGSSILMAYDMKPELFSHLILLDPVLLPYYVLRAASYLPTWLKLQIAPPSRIARVRQEHYESHQEVFEKYRSKRVFKDIADIDLERYVESAFVKSTKGVSLRWGREWEARIYATVSYTWPILKKVNIPTLCIRGVNSNVVTDDSWSRWQSYMPKAKFVELENVGHLVPLERPTEVAKIINTFLDDFR